MRFAAPDGGAAGILSEALLAPRSSHVHGVTPTAFSDDTGTGGMCSPDGDMLWQKSPDGKQNRYWLCYAPASRHGSGQGPTGGSLQCEPNSYVSVEGPRYCCRHPRIMFNGVKLHAKSEVCGDVLADFDPAAQKMRLQNGPSTDGTPELIEALQQSSLGTLIPSPIGMEAMKEGNEWKLLLGQRCQGRDGTLIKWPTGRAEMCPTGSQPVQGAGYMSWQCDSSYKKNFRLHCCSVKSGPGGAKKMKCVPNMVNQSNSLGCQCEGINAGGWGEEEPLKLDEHGNPINPVAGLEKAGQPPQAKPSSGLPPLNVVMLTAFGAPHRCEACCRRGSRQLGHHFL